MNEHMVETLYDTPKTNINFIAYIHWYYFWRIASLSIFSIILLTIHHSSYTFYFSIWKSKYAFLRDRYLRTRLRPVTRTLPKRKTTKNSNFSSNMRCIRHHRHHRRRHCRRSSQSPRLLDIVVVMNNKKIVSIIIVLLTDVGEKWRKQTVRQDGGTKCVRHDETYFFGNPIKFN